MGRDIISKSRELSGEIGALLAILETTREGVILPVQLQPRAAKNKLAGMLGSSLKVKVTAAPVEGAANDALCELVAKIFGIAKGRVRVVFGLRSRRKKVLLAGMDKATVASQIAELLHRNE